MTNTSKNRGTAGTIMVVMVFGFLMTISTAYIKMVQTETEVQGMIDHTDRAMDAAFSGINYTMAVAQTKKEMFMDDVTEAKKRLYFIGAGTTWTTALGLTFNLTNFPIATTTDWLFLNESLQLFEATDTATQAYRFRIHSYPGVSAPGTIAPGSYTIKVQGQYRVFSGATVVSTFSTQLIAQCEIKFASKVVQLKRWRQMKYQVSADFFKASAY